MQPIEPTLLGRLYRQHVPALRLYARQWGEGGEDLVQDAFIRLAKQTPTPERVVPWLYRVVRNEALANYRSSGRRRQRELQACAPEAWFSAVEDRLDAEEAKRLLVELPLEAREVIVARLWGGLTFAEVAQLVDCSLAMAHRRYHAGLAELKERLEGRWLPTITTPTT